MDTIDFYIGFIDMYCSVYIQKRTNKKTLAKLLGFRSVGST